MKSTVIQAEKETKYNPVRDLNVELSRHIGFKQAVVMYLASPLMAPVNANREHWVTVLNREGKQETRMFLCLDGEIGDNGETLTKEDCPVCCNFSGKQPKKNWYIPVICDLFGDDNYRVYFLTLDPDKYKDLKDQLIGVGCDPLIAGHCFGMYKETKEKTAKKVFAQGMIPVDKLKPEIVAKVQEAIKSTDFDELDNSFDNVDQRRFKYDRFMTQVVDSSFFELYNNYLKAHPDYHVKDLSAQN